MQRFEQGHTIEVYDSWDCHFSFQFLSEAKVSTHESVLSFCAYSSCVPRLTSTHSASYALGFLVALSSSKVLKSFNGVFSTSYRHIICKPSISLVSWSCLHAGEPLGIQVTGFCGVSSYQCYCAWCVY